MRVFCVAALTIALSGCAAGTAEEPGGGLLEMMYGVGPAETARIAARVADKPLGSEANPVRVNMPSGQRAYLSRLRCANGRAPTFSRVGSMGQGPYGSIIDGYEVICAGSSPATSQIYLDMYHPNHVENTAPPGFTIAP